MAWTVMHGPFSLFTLPHGRGPWGSLRSLDRKCLGSHSASFYSIHYSFFVLMHLLVVANLHLSFGALWDLESLQFRVQSIVDIVLM